jgi:DEAD/DEAH box helicase domain-containing protein
MNQVILDVETIRTFDEVGGYHPEKLGVSFCGVIVRDGFPENGDTTETKHELFEADLPELLPILEHADVIIGYNSINFDLPALTPYFDTDILKFSQLDLMVKIKDSAGHRVSLDAVAGETLGTKKIGHGLDAIKYYQNKEFDKLAKYCMKDVEITRDLYDYGRQHSHVKFLNKWNNLIKCDVDFNFEPPQNSGTQMSLV